MLPCHKSESNINNLNCSVIFLYPSKRRETIHILCKLNRNRLCNLHDVRDMSYDAGMGFIFTNVHISRHQRSSSHAII